MVILAVLALIAVVIALYFVSTYNALVRLKNKLFEASAGIDVHLKERYDLIPNLVETVKGYAKHESGTLEAVIKARNSAIVSTSFSEKEKADQQVSGALGKLFALSEAYPELKADTSFVNLQNKLTAVEHELLNQRKYYNAIAREINTKIELFPSSIVANMSGYTKYPYAEVEEEAKKRVEVKF
ncbi:MAG: LemA family protein [Sphaerochaetaceae bacterium]|nr:LemA family protein [Sphaerochaetaceae bacterium]